MSRVALFVCLPLLGLWISGCQDEGPFLCYGGTCESVEECQTNCEQVCIDGDFNADTVECSMEFGECGCDCNQGCLEIE